MTTPKKTNKQNRLRGLLLLPLALLTFIIGWTLIWIGSNKKPQKPQTKQQNEPKPKEDNVTLMVIHPEEQELTVKNYDN